MNRYVLILLLTSTLPVFAQPPVPAADYAVYAAWLRYWHRGDPKFWQRGDTLVYVATQTQSVRNAKTMVYAPADGTGKPGRPRPSADTLLIQLDTLRRPEWAELLSRYNATSPTDPLLLDAAKLNAALSNELMVRSYAGQTGNVRVPHVVLSAVTYSADGQRAMFSYDFRCPRCGIGLLVFMHRVAGQWVPYARITRWMS